MNKQQKFIVLCVSVLVFGWLLSATNTQTVIVKVTVTDSDATTVTAVEKDNSQNSYSANVEEVENSDDRRAYVSVPLERSYIFSDDKGNSVGPRYISSSICIRL